MEITDDAACYYHAEFLVRFYPDVAVDCLAESKSQKEIKAFVERRCLKMNEQYLNIMRLAQSRNWDEIERRKTATCPSSTQGVSSHTSPPQPVSLRPHLPFSNPNPPPSPSVSTTSKSQVPSPPERITVLGGDTDTFLTMKPSHNRFSYIRADIVLERFPGIFIDQGIGVNASMGPCYNAAISGRSVQLTFYRNSSASCKTHQERFYLHEALDTADMLLNFEILQSRVTVPPLQDVPGGPPNFHPSFNHHAPQTPEFAHKHPHSRPYYPDIESHHPSSVYTQVQQRSTGFDIPSYSTRMGGAPQAERNSPIVRNSSPINSMRRSPVSAIRHQQHSPLNPDSASHESKPTDASCGEVTGLFSSGSSRVIPRAFDLCQTGQSFFNSLNRVCRPLKIKLDPDHHYVELLSNTDGTSHVVWLDDTFQSEWRRASVFLKNNVSDTKTEIRVKIVNPDELDGG